MSLLLLSAVLYCTSQALELVPRRLIVHGTPINAAKYPWMVSVRKVIPASHWTDHYCGGSLIQLSPPIVLTAAHCVRNGAGGHYDYYDHESGTFMYSEDVDDTYVRSTPIEFYADINRTNAAENTEKSYQTLQITSLSMIHIHEKYTFSDKWNGYDIALLIFDDGQTVTGLSNQHIPFVAGNVMDEQWRRDKLIVTGYGNDATNGESTDILEMTTMHYVDVQHCGGIIQDYADDPFNYVEALEHDVFICAAGDDTDICYGDSGGPLFDYVHGPDGNWEVHIYGVYSLSVILMKCTPSSMRISCT